MIYLFYNEDAKFDKNKFQHKFQHEKEVTQPHLVNSYNKGMRELTFWIDCQNRTAP